MKPGTLTKENLAALKELTDEQRAELISRLDEIAEMETQLARAKAEKVDADQIIARAGEMETASKAKDQKITELEGLVAKFTARKMSYGIFAPFFGED